MKGRVIPYLPQELAWIEERKHLPRAEAHQLFCTSWKRDDVSFSAFVGLCNRKGWKTGRSGYFERGIVPHNKGKTMPPEVRDRFLATAFKPGNLPHNANYLGHERLSKEGYVEVSVAETNPLTGFERRYVLKHVWLWERANGPVPEGHALKCLDGNRRNTDPANWEALPRALLPRLAGNVGRRTRTVPYDTAPDELKPAILATAKLAHAIREARK